MRFSLGMSSGDRPRGRSVSPILTDGFETGTYATWWTSDYPLVANYDPTVAGVFRYQSTVKRSGTYAIRYHLVGGGPDDQEPFKLTVEGAQWVSAFGASSTNELFVEFWVRSSASYPWGASGQKLCRIGHYDAGLESSSSVVGLIVQGNNTNLQLRTFRQDLLDDKFENPAIPMVDQTWTKFGMYAKINTPDVSNGIASLYLNDTRVAHINNMLFITTGQEAFNYFWIGGNNSNSGSPPVSDGDLYFDDIKIYRTIPY